MDDMTKGVLASVKINSLFELRRCPQQNMRCGYLLLIMAANIFTDLPMGADLQVAGYNLDTAKEEVDCTVLINKQQYPPDGIIRPQPTLHKAHE